MIVGSVNVLLLAADIATNVFDGMSVVFTLLDYNYFQKFILIGFTFAFSIFIGVDLKTMLFNLMIFLYT